MSDRIATRPDGLPLAQGLPISVVWWIGLTAVATWILLRTRFGNWIFATGGDPVAARNVGVPVARVKILLFMAMAMTATLFAAIQVLDSGSADTLRGRYNPPQRCNPQVTRSVSRIVERALASDPRLRYGGAREMLADLTRCRADCSWTRCDDSEALEAWRTQTRRGTVGARLLPAKHGVVLEVKLNRGSGPRRVRPDQLLASEARGREALRRLMRRVVEGRELG